MSALETCTAIKADGERCQVEFGLKEDGKCLYHSAYTADTLREGQRAGGRATAEKHRRTGLEESELPQLVTHADAKARLDLISRAVATGRLDKGDAASAINGVKVWLVAMADEVSAKVVNDLERALAAKEKELDELRRRLARHESGPRKVG